MRRIQIYSIFNHNPEFIRLQFESIRRNLLDKDYEYIVVNNARNAGVRQLVQSLQNDESTLYDVFLNLVKTLNRKYSINKICKELGIRVVLVKENNRPDAYSRFPSRIVAYTLNWLFSIEIQPKNNANIVCLVDSDMFFISPVCIEELIDGKEIGIIPQLRGAQIRYLWTGFAVFDFLKLPYPENLDFSLGEVGGMRTDVGGMTHHYLREHVTSIVEFEFVNLETEFRVKTETYVETNINGYVSLNLKFDKNFKVIEMECKGEQEHIKYTLGSDESEILSNYASSIAEVVRFSSGLKLNPKSIDLIRRKHKADERFFILHYKNGSNPPKFADKNYSVEKMKWCSNVVLNQGG